MKITLNKMLVCLLVLLAILLYASYKTIKRQHKELERQENNLTALNTEAVAFKTTAGDYAEQARQLKLEKDELELYNADLYNKVREAGIKIRELKNATRAETVTRVDTVVKTEYRDGAKKTDLRTISMGGMIYKLNPNRTQQL
jgi:predicted  nucleic acid-binding Zn-ribbon protein